MKLITMSVCLIAMLLTHTVQAQTYNDDYEPLSKSESAAMKDYMNLHMDHLEKSIYARLDGVTLEEGYASMSLVDMICNYECMYAVKSEALIYFENMELLPIMYDEDEQFEIAEEMGLNFTIRVLEMDACACMMEK